MDIPQLPAVSDEPILVGVDSHCGGPSRSLCMAPAAEATGNAVAPTELVDLIAASLRALCRDEHDSARAFWLMARIIDLHLADTLSHAGMGRWRKEAHDALLGMLSQPLQLELHRHLEQRESQARQSAAAAASPPHH